MRIDHANWYIEEKMEINTVSYQNKYNFAWNGIRDEIKEVSSDIIMKNIKRKLNLNLTLNKPLQLCLMTIIIRCVFKEDFIHNFF